MFFLAGLLGMMMLGSFAVVTTADPAEDDQTDFDIDNDESAEGGENAALSLFEQLGLIEQGGAPGTTGPEHDAGDDGLTAEGGAGDDTLTGTDHVDLLGGAGGDDLLIGGGGGDDIVGGAGTDTLWGDAGDDTLHGEAGHDRINGGGGDDSLFGHDGDDHIAGGMGDDVAWGGLGFDEMAGDAGNDALHGREGDDTLIGGAGQDTLFGGWQNDVLDGRSGEDAPETDYLNGGAGADLLILGPGDMATGGADADTFVAGDWLTVESATLTDFDSFEDQLVIVYDDTAGEGEPTLELRMNDDDPTVTDVLVDGALILTIPTVEVPTADGIVLVGESDAAALGMV